MAATDILQLLWGSVRQTNRLLRLHTPLGGDVLVAERLDGWEAVDQGGFRFELSALSPNAMLPLDALLGAPVLVELLTADSRIDLRPFHGHVTAFERVGSNGGMARYTLVIEPWLSLLHLRQDSYAFHDLSVIEIVEQVFGHYTQGVVMPAWRWELADRSVYLKRSLTTQYQESDAAFVQRLLAEEGVFYWFEHAGDAASPSLGTHTLVLADSNNAFQPGHAASVRYHRSDATEKDDTIQHWAPARRWQTGQLARASWDYRTLSTRPAQAQVDGPAVDATDDDTAGPYAWPNLATGQRRAQQQLDARHVCSSLIDGSGSVRRLAPGQSFQLVDHPTQTAEALACLRVEHHARNNLDAEVQGAVEKTLGNAMQTLSSAATPESPLAGVRGQGEGRVLATASYTSDNEAKNGDVANDHTPLYQNTFIALPIARTYRPHTPDGHGLRRHPVASASGAQSAVVVGNGNPIHTDRDHRVIVQQHWQRGGNAANRLDHPRDANAPADASAGTWARVTTPLAGANWGSVALPRVGQEVWLGYLEGDIDRPVVLAGLYNGQGNRDAPFNQQSGGPSGASGNAAAWFTGNDHAGVLSGFKSQDLSSSARGSGGYRQLRFDDTPTQSHAQLATTDYESALTLGHFKLLDDNQRSSDLGYGAALSTLAQGALRGGTGLLLSSAPGTSQMDASGPIGVLNQNTQLAQSLTDVAQKQQAGLPDEPSPDKLPAVATQTETSQHLAGTRDGTSAGAGIDGGQGSATAWSKPHLVVHGQDGLVTVTPKQHVWVSGTDTTLSAGQDLNLVAQGQLAIVAAKGIALYAQGSEAGSRPVKQAGIALHAASGSVSIQAQQDKADLAAEKAVTMASTNGNINASAKQHVLLAAAGAYLKLEGGDIEIGAPSKAEFKAKQREMAGGQSASAAQVALAKAELKLCEFKTRKADADGEGIIHAG
ncbi:type VI secretion system secreted protein VgrG [Rhodanobacter sp. TND4EL1]